MCKKCDARAELLFCLLNLMFRDTVASLDLKVPIDVVELTIHRVYQVLNDWRGMRYRKQLTIFEFPIIHSVCPPNFA